ncbi:MAG: hypothetical protein RBG1_1C00001G1249 [candidate division Zixibacteria bacterium RBG-1]|nr:MAG: hypothetical protein RBG1_1C00001G1249 [candidate division Zixibacteria bacterium RBG-1]
MKKIEKLLIILVSSILMTTAGGLKSEGQLFSQHLADNVIANSDSYQKLEKPAIDSLVSNNPGRKVYNKAFGVGEKLEYSVNYGFINAGNAVMEIDTVIDIRGRKCFRVTSTARSNKFFSTFYRVNDRVLSFIDVEGIYSLWFEKHLREGNFKSDRWISFLQDQNLAVNNKQDTLKVPEFVQDVLSAMYYIRTQPLEVGKSLLVDNHTDNKNYPLEVKILRKEKIKVGAGKFECFVVEPLLQEGAGVFQHKGKLTVWLTDDQHRLPVLMKSKIFVGSISAELERYSVGKIENQDELSGN